VWRHLDTCQYQTLLHARVPRVGCPTHGVRQVRVPWAGAEPIHAVDGASHHRLDPPVQHGDRRVPHRGHLVGRSLGRDGQAVARGRARKQAMPMRSIGVDEKAFRKGHRYHTIVCDLERSTVEFVAEDRRIESLGVFYDQLTPEQRDALAGVAMDMWEPYIQATRTRLPDGDQRIVFDRFHIMREMTHAVDTVRKQEHRAFLRADGDWPLTRSKYFWLVSEERLPARHAEAFADLQALELKVGRA
jgi:transposase